ncbi:MAG: energy-coupling factor transporter ATP-binding protein EcfA2 [Ilumatobacter sp.]|jgi:energy-coupling factor transporter ATP-binding protein EcfA2
MSTRSGPTRFTSQRILDAESCVLASVKESAPFQMDAVIDPILGEDEVDAVVAMTESGRCVTTVIGPAGAGKTTLLKSVAQTCEAAGRDVMILMLSAAAVRVVTEETSIPASTIASWAIGRVDMPRGGLVVIDEASMVPTLTLENLVRVSEVYGTRLAFVGDYAQMGAPEAGGLLHDLAAGPSAVTLTAVRRFTKVPGQRPCQDCSLTVIEQCLGKRYRRETPGGERNAMR